MLRGDLGTRSGLKWLKSKRIALPFMSYSRSEISSSSLIYPNIYVLSLSLFLPLVYPISFDAACRIVGSRTCPAPCGTQNCGIPSNDRPKCNNGQYLKEDKLGCTYNGYCSHTVYHQFSCTYKYSCVCFLSLNSFLGLSLTLQNIISSSVRDDINGPGYLSNGRGCLSLSRVCGCGGFWRWR